MLYCVKMLLERGWIMDHSEDWLLEYWIERAWIEYAERL